MKKNSEPNNTKPEDKLKQQRTPLKKKRAGVVLSRHQVKEIKAGRKKLRKDLKKAGIKSKKDFEVTAASLGLYFDKPKGGLFWLLLKGKALWALLGAAALFLSVLFLFSLLEQMRGHFTINLSEDMLNKGFILSETEDFSNPVTVLYCEPKTNVAATSISHIPTDVMDHQGMYDDDTVFAYSFFMKYEGEETGHYRYDIKVNSEYLDVSKACWVMVFADGEMSFYAEEGADGLPESIPAQNDNSRGYPEAYFMDYAKNPADQYEIIKEIGNAKYYRLIPKPFNDERRVTRQDGMALNDQEYHKYTVVIWLEGDDPECVNDIIGGHLGLQMNFALLGEEEEEDFGLSNEGLLDNLGQYWVKFIEDLESLFGGLKYD